ncbi:MAG: TetR/AcrR family transcriptional regulator [Oscillospiraceae bacterium]|jgi:AcrR family transcriptional regulator|nr:TetR/AcrR family transcriptional regulator [Oscillospiraceae bacterium]
MRNPENDHRVRVTKMFIRKAYILLLRKKPEESVSITEICELANINRGTFYKHYTDVSDLRAKIAGELTAEFEKHLGSHSKEDSIAAGDTITAVFRYFRDNAELSALAFSSRGEELCKAVIEKTAVLLNPNLPDEYRRFIAAGGAELLRSAKSANFEPSLVASAVRILAHEISDARGISYGE